MELDIDELPNSLLVKLHAFVTKHCNDSGSKSSRSFEYHPPSAYTDVSPPSQVASATRPKKNKPMSASEQEAKIASLQRRLAAFGETGAPGAQSPEGML